MTKSHGRLRLMAVYGASNRSHIKVSVWPGLEMNILP